MREWLEYVAVWWMAKIFGLLPRRVARGLGASVGAVAYGLLSRLRRVGLRNLELAFPEMPLPQRVKLLRDEYRNLGWLLAEFCLMSRYTQKATASFISVEGLDNYLRARAKGRGVFVVTGHLGAWELSSFYHSLMGYPMNIVIRRLDNARIDRFGNRIRCLHGNRVIHKDDFARGLLQSMRSGETVGILMDTNMTPPQGVFVDFFGHLACTASGLAPCCLKDRRSCSSRLHGVGGGKAEVCSPFWPGVATEGYRTARRRSA